MRGFELAFDDVSSRPDAAPVVLFVHGFPLDRRLFRAQGEAVARHGARALLPDLRGFGRTQGPSPQTIDAHADDLARLLESLGVSRAIVVGLSMGGYIALAFARRHRAALAGLLLADTKAGPDDAQAREARAANMLRARSDGVAAVFEAMRDKTLATAEPSVVESLRAIAAEQSPAGAVAALEAMRDRPDATPHLRSIAVPTQVVVGREDRATPPVEAELLARTIPGAKLTVIEGAGHFTNVERPREFDAALLDLIDRVR